MKPLFKNITIYNSKIYNQFVKFHEDKFNFSYTIYTLIMSLLIIYCIVLNIIQKNVLFVFLFLFMLIFTIFIRIYLPIKRFEKTKKKYSKNKQTSYHFTFYRFHFTVEGKTYLYSKLYKIFETNDYFYLYIDQESAVLVSKNGFKLGTAKEFSDFIKRKCFFKYNKQIKGT